MVETREISVRDYIDLALDQPRISGYCKLCNNYGRLWSCPPLSFDIREELSKWKWAVIIACRFELASDERTPEKGMKRLREERKVLDNMLLRMEKDMAGLAFGFSGECRHCNECSRIQGLECRHPELVRPALEAYGFDVEKTMHELFGYDLEWAPAGKMPGTVTLVGAVFHNMDATAYIEK